MKNAVLLILTFLPLFAFGQYGKTIRTGRPGQAIGGFALGKDVFQLQSGYNFNQIEKEEASISRTAHTTILRWGLTEHFELSGVTNWQSDKMNFDTLTTFIGGISNTQIGGRINISKNKGWLPTIGIQGRVLLKAQSEPYKRKNLGSKFIVATGNALADKISVITNWGMTFAGNNQSPTFSYILNLSYSINNKWGTFAEVYGNLNEFSTNLDAGISYLVNKDFQLDFSTGWQGNNEITDWFTDFGLSWRLDWRKTKSKD